MAMSSSPSRTETPNAAHAELDRYDTPDLLGALVDDHALAVQAVKAATPQLVKAVEATAERLARGGRSGSRRGKSGRVGQRDRHGSLLR